MDRDRVELSELKAIKELSQVFTAKVWDTAVFALTFAKRVLLPPTTKVTRRQQSGLKSASKSSRR